LNAALAIAILHLISQVHLPSFVNMLSKFLKYSTFCSCFCSSIIFTGNGCLVILITFFLHSFPFHSIFQFQLVYQSCPVGPFLPQPVTQGHLHISQCVNNLPSYFEVSKPFQSFLGKAFAVQVEQNW